jgi:hypothetical protein
MTYLKAIVIGQLAAFGLLADSNRTVFAGTSNAATAGWIERAPIQLNGLRVTLAEPALVKRSRWFCWFPSLIRQPNGTLWAVMSAYGDYNVPGSFCYLARSRDGGLTWDEARVIGDAGLSHLLLADGSAVVLPYYLRPRTGGTIGAPCNIIAPDGHLIFRPAGVNVTGWPRTVKSLGPDLGTAGFVFNGQVARGKKGEYLTTLYGHFEGDNRYSLALAESADGFAWRIRSIIAGTNCALKGKEGPCESAICRLPASAPTNTAGAGTNRLMCVFRLDSFVPYGQTWSEDEGRTWSKPVAMSAASVEPSLQVLSNGVIALSGGRPGISVWFNTDGKGVQWQSVDIVAHHNACRPRERINPDSTKAWKTPSEMSNQNLGGFTSSYTELIPMAANQLLLIYDRLGLGWNEIPDHSPESNSVWVLRITLEKE